MESFNSLLLKLKEVHEREVEGWQMKIQELSNKKGCDSKRMDELFSKNQQMKEQQRLLTENIKTLENRLRAGLCDRCTVTQEVAKRRQQEFEASQVQSLQHISLLASEMNSLKKENKRLRDEIRSLRAALDSTDVKANSPPDPPASSGPVSLISLATSRSSSQPAGGEVSVKTETEQRAEETDVRAWRTNNRSFESYKPLTSPTWKTETQSRAAERRSQSVEGLEQRPHPQPVPVPLKTSPSSSSSSSSSPSQGSDVTPSRHHVHPSIPCRPQPIRGSPVSIPWSLSDSSDWVSGPVPTLLATPQIKPLPPRFPNLVLSSHGRRPALIGQVWSKQSPLKPPKEPTVLFRLRGLQENQMKTAEKKEPRPSLAGEGPAEGWEGPLDLSERGTARSDAGSTKYLDLSSDKVKISLDKKIDPSETSSAAPPSSSSSSSSPAKQDKDTSTTPKEVSEQREELNAQTEQKKVPVLTLSLRPVVVLENLNSALHKQEASSHSKSSSAETGSSSDGQEEEASSSGPESNCQRKRKWKGGGSESDRDSDTEDVRQERKIQISLRTEEKTVS